MDAELCGGGGTEETMPVDMQSDSGISSQLSTASSVSSAVSDTDTLMADQELSPPQPDDLQTDHGPTDHREVDTVLPALEAEHEHPTGPESNVSTLRSQTEIGAPGQPPVFPGRQGQDGSTDSGYASNRPGHQQAQIPPVALPEAARTPFDIRGSQSRTEAWVEKHFDVFLKDCEGKNHTLQVTENTTVQNFRQKVKDRIGMPPDQQVLTTQGGKVMQDGQTMKSCQVQALSTIYCTGRLRGGRGTAE